MMAKKKDSEKLPEILMQTAIGVVPGVNADLITLIIR